MKRRDIFRVPARVKKTDPGWTVILTFPGAEVSLHYDEKPLITESPITLVLEYTVPEDG